MNKKAKWYLIHGKTHDQHTGIEETESYVLMVGCGYLCCNIWRCIFEDVIIIDRLP